jgi:hypothetical protein
MIDGPRNCKSNRIIYTGGAHLETGGLAILPSLCFHMFQRPSLTTVASALLKESRAQKGQLAVSQCWRRLSPKGKRIQGRAQLFRSERSTRSRYASGADY